MTVSDESAGNGSDSKQPKPKPNWPAIRREYETSTISQRDLAQSHAIPASTLMKHAMREKWSQNAKLVAKTAAKLEAELDERAVDLIRDELGPLIEKHKVKITKRGIRIGNRGLSRIEALWRKYKPSDSKAEADGARAAETFLRMARTSLGMTDGNGPAGSLSMKILAGQAAIQINGSAA